NVVGGVTSVTIGSIGVRGPPIIMAEMWLREGDEHSDVISGFENLFKTKVSSWFAAVVVRINEVDSKTLEPLHAFARACVGRKRGTDLRVIQRYGREKYSRTVQKEIATIYP